MKDTILGAVGVLLVLGTVFGGNLQYLSDWSTGELVGFNVASLLSVIGGGYLAYRWFKTKRSR